ncbi:MAG: hypothetical protein ABJN04_05960 [Hyphomicrobiales bacterium]
MTQFRILITLILLGLIGYGLILVLDGRFDFVTPFLTTVPALTWQGHINLDFLSYLVVAGVWIAWRSGFTPIGITIGVLSTLLGMLFFAPYLLYQITRSDNDPRKLLLGVHAEN